MRDKLQKILKQLLPVFILLILFLFIKNEFLIAFLIILTMAIAFKIEYHKKEIYVVLFGLTLGILLELFGSLVLGFQYWKNTLLVMPVWLPLAWGYGFVVIRRVGEVIIETSRK